MEDFYIFPDSFYIIRYLQDMKFRLSICCYNPCKVIFRFVIQFYIYALSVMHLVLCTSSERRHQRPQQIREFMFGPPQAEFQDLYRFLKHRGKPTSKNRFKRANTFNLNRQASVFLWQRTSARNSHGGHLCEEASWRQPQLLRLSSQGHQGAFETLNCRTI